MARLAAARAAANTPAPTPSNVVPIASITAGHPYAQKALTLEAAKVAGATEGTRNHTLNSAAFSLGQLVASGSLNANEVTETLLAAARHCGLTEHEARGTIRSGFRGGATSPRDIPEITVDVTEIAAPIPTPALEAFWQSRPVLDHIRTFAYARMTSPWSVLGVTLLRTLATVPPHVVLPPIIGGYGSLNLFIALVGPSGSGKGATEAAAADAIRTPLIYTAPVGSGEGIAHQYAHREKGGIVRDRDAVLFTIPEVDTLGSLSGRQGSTLLPQLRSAFSGERLGFGYADENKRIPIEAHSYRLGITCGVQPERAAVLLNDSDGGTPQRFIWLPATDPNISARPPAEPAPRNLPNLDWTPNKTCNDGYRRHLLTVPEEVEQVIRESHAARGRGQGDTLDGHALYAREKVAQALAILDGRRGMDLDDWALSGVIMSVSDITRAKIAATLTARIAVEDERRAEREAKRQVKVATTLADAAIKRACKAILNHAGAGTLASELHRKLRIDIREYFDDALTLLVETGQVEVVEGAGAVTVRRLEGAK